VLSFLLSHLILEPIMFKNFLSYLNSRIFWIWLLFFSFITLIISPENSAYYGIFVIYIIYYLIFSFNQKIFWLFITFVVITLSLYQPIYSSYGNLNSGVVAAFFETNPAESFEFLGKLKIDQFILPFYFHYQLISYID